MLGLRQRRRGVGQMPKAVDSPRSAPVTRVRARRDTGDEAAANARRRRRAGYRAARERRRRRGARRDTARRRRPSGATGGWGRRGPAAAANGALGAAGRRETGAERYGRRRGRHLTALSAAGWNGAIKTDDSSKLGGRGEGGDASGDAGARRRAAGGRGGGRRGGAGAVTGARRRAPSGGARPGGGRRGRTRSGPSRGDDGGAGATRGRREGRRGGGDGRRRGPAGAREGRGRGRRGGGPGGAERRAGRAPGEEPAGGPGRGAARRGTRGAARERRGGARDGRDVTARSAERLVRATCELDVRTEGARRGGGGRGPRAAGRDCHNRRHGRARARPLALDGDPPGGGGGSQARQPRRLAGGGRLRRVRRRQHARPDRPARARRLWTALDGLASGRNVHVLTTIGWHRRSRDEVVKRYGASTSRARTSLPTQVVPIPLRGAGETMLWLPEVRTLVPGDRLLGNGQRRRPRLPGLVAPLPEGPDRRRAAARPPGAAARPAGRAHPHLARRAGALRRPRGAPARARVNVSELAPGLWRWTAPHPDWKEGDDWERDVGCVYYEAAGRDRPDRPARAARAGAVLRGARPRRRAAWAARGDPAHRPWHERSTDELTERYGATPAPPAGVEPFATLRGRGDAVVAAASTARSSSATCCSARRTAVAVCPDSWARTGGSSQARDPRRALRLLLDLPVERILVSHGKPVLEGGRAALERALGLSSSRRRTRPRRRHRGRGSARRSPGRPTRPPHGRPRREARRAPPGCRRPRRAPRRSRTAPRTPPASRLDPGRRGRSPRRVRSPAGPARTGRRSRLRRRRAGRAARPRRPAGARPGSCGARPSAGTAPDSSSTPARPRSATRAPIRCRGAHAEPGLEGLVERVDPRRGSGPILAIASTPRSGREPCAARPRVSMSKASQPRCAMQSRSSVGSATIAASALQRWRSGSVPMLAASSSATAVTMTSPRSPSPAHSTAASAIAARLAFMS